MTSNASAYFLIASCSLPSKLSAQSFSCAAANDSGAPPPATISGFSITSFTTISESWIERSTSSITLWVPPRINNVTDCGCLQPSMKTHLSDSTFFWWAKSAEPRSFSVKSSKLLITRPSVAFESFIISLSLTRRTAMIPCFAR